MQSNSRKHFSGFTLIELLVVITIISILTIITVSQFQAARRKAADVQRKGDINALSKALQMYYADYGRFPISVGGSLPDSGGSNGLAWGGEFKDAANYTYMKTTPREKVLTSFPFCYVTDTSGTKYGIFAMLENTADSQCQTSSNIGIYSHCGGVRYCYAYVSQNIVATDLDSYIP